jgi:cytidine deaminase
MRSGDQELFAQAEAAARKAYAPYSNFRVGAAVRTRSGRVLTGVNVENAAYPLGVCAERAAIASAVSEGARPGDLDTLAVTASPCGGCRQWLAEFRVDRIVYRAAGGQVVAASPADLLPDGFEL